LRGPDEIRQMQSGPSEAESTIDCELEVIFEADAAIGDDERITKQDAFGATVRIINQQDSRAGR